MKLFVEICGMGRKGIWKVLSFEGFFYLDMVLCDIQYILFPLRNQFFLGGGGFLACQEPNIQKLPKLMVLLKELMTLNKKILQNLIFRLEESGGMRGLICGRSKLKQSKVWNISSPN